MVELFEAYVACSRRGDPSAFGRDVLMYYKDHRAQAVDVDLANGQFMSAALSAMPFSQGYEPDILAVLSVFLPKDGVFYDIGANWGYFSFHLLLDPGFGGKVVAFEPVSRSYGDLTRLAQAFDVGPRLTTVQAAIAAEPGYSQISGDFWSGNQSLEAGTYSGEIVRIQTLDGLDLPDPHLMKLDVENSEAAVLLGATALLNRARPVVVFESWKNDDPNKTEKPFHILRECGYRFFVPELDARVGALSLATSWRGAMTLKPIDVGDRLDLPDRINVLALPDETLDQGAQSPT